MLRARIPAFALVTITIIFGIGVTDAVLALAGDPIVIAVRQWMATAVVTLTILTGITWRASDTTMIDGLSEIKTDLIELAKHQINGPEAQAIQASAVAATVEEVRNIVHTEVREVIREELHYVLTQQNLNVAVEEAMIPTLRALADYRSTAKLADVIHLTPRDGRMEQ